MEKPKTLIFIPVINELDNLKLIIQDLRNNMKISEILIIDDASDDGTGSYFASIPKDGVVRLNYWYRNRRLGIGTAHLDALEFACSNAFDFAVSMDGDLTHTTRDVNQLIVELTKNDSDLIIGSRFLKESRIIGWSTNRILLTKAAHFLTSLLLDMDEDLSSGLRGYKVSKIPLQSLRNESMAGYEFFFKSAAIFRRQGRIINQIPVNLYARNSGESKMKISNAMSGLSKLISFKMKQYTKPR